MSDYKDSDKFLGQSHYQPNLENIFDGLGITGIQYVFDNQDCFTEDCTFVGQPNYWSEDKNKK